MSDTITPAKRSLGQMDLEPTGREKRHQSLPAEKSSKGNYVLRVLCPSSKVDNVVGEGGSKLAWLKKQSGAEVSVEEPMPGCDERVVVIVGVCDGGMLRAERNVKEGVDKVEDVSHTDEKGGNDNAGEVDNQHEDGKGGAGTDNEVTSSTGQRNNELEADKNKNHDGSNGDEKEKDVERDASRSLKAIESAQKALLLVIDKIAEEEAGGGASDERNKRASPFVVRMLVLSNQVGCVLGKGGSVIKKMSAESGAQMRILPRDKLPLCASGLNELIVISGRLPAVRKALHLASQRLLENLPRERDQHPANKLPGYPSTPSGPHSHAENVHHADFRLSARGRHFGAETYEFAELHPDLGPPFPRFHDDVFPGRMAMEMLTFRLLCMTEHIGSIIGKGGSIIRSLQFETGADIRIVEGLAETDVQVVVISAPVHPEDRVAAAQDALLRVQSRIFQTDPNADRTVQARLLVSSNQTGCLLGKGGAIIAEMRKITGAHIRILGKDQVPQCALENEEVVQVTGNYEAVHEALFQITSRLRDHVFRERFSSPTLPHGPGFRDLAPPFTPFSGRRDALPHGIHSNLRSSYRKFDGPDGFPPLDDEPPFMREVHRPGPPPFFPDRAPWTPKNLRDNVATPSVGLSDYSGLPQRRNSFEGASQPAVITSTTIEVVVPQSLVPSLYGEDEFCINKIREISEAKITITEPRPGVSETTIVISGAPDETHAAQSLLQAFVMSEAESSELGRR